MSRTEDRPRPPQASSTLPEWLTPHLEATDAEIERQLMGRELPGISRGVDYQLGGNGKRLRPAITSWLAAALGAPPPTRQPFALAVELLHNVFLIHDDIEDGDRFRRGKPTLWVAVGVAEALNVADYLLARAYRLVGESSRRVPRNGGDDEHSQLELFAIFTQAFETTVEGQALDLQWRADPSFTIEKYEEIIRKKTGRYLALGWVGAGLMGGLSREQAFSFWRIGDELGPAFQIKDDLLDLTEGKGRGGELGCDIREGKPSILFAHALASPELTPSERQAVVGIHARAREQTTAKDVERVVALYRRIGSLEYAAKEMRRRVERGMTELEQLHFVSPEVAARFRELADYLIERKV